MKPYRQLNDRYVKCSSEEMRAATVAMLKAFGFTTPQNEGERPYEKYPDLVVTADMLFGYHTPVSSESDRVLSLDKFIKLINEVVELEEQYQAGQRRAS